VEKAAMKRATAPARIYGWDHERTTECRLRQQSWCRRRRRRRRNRCNPVGHRVARKTADSMAGEWATLAETEWHHGSTR